MIKCLIQAYPSALLGPPDGYTIHSPVYMIANHPEHCVLMPWVATNYTWVLDHERCIQAVFALLRMYNQRQRTSCSSTTIKDFFEAYPPALTKRRNGMSILHMILRPQECEVNLFKWMAGQCPSSILLEADHPNGNLPLHISCLLLSMSGSSNSNKICKYLIDNGIYSLLPHSCIARYATTVILGTVSTSSKQLVYTDE